MNHPKAPLLTRTPIVAAIAIFCCALWGSATPFIKLGYELMLSERDVPSTILFAGIRFALAGLLTVLIYSIAYRRFLFPKKENFGKIAVVSLFQTVLQYLFFYVGLANTTGVKGTIGSGSSAFFSLLIAGLIFRAEKLTPKKLLACALGFAGIVFVNLRGLTLTMNLLGDGFVLFSAVAYGFSTVLIKRFSRYEHPVVLSGYQFIVGGLLMVVIGLALGGQIQILGIAAVGVLLYLALLSAAAYSLWGMLLQHNPVSRVTIYHFTTPVFGVILSSLMLSESSHVSPINLVLSLALVSSGILLLNYRKNEK